MKKRGYVISWQNRHWATSPSAYSGGGTDPNIPPGGGGTLPEFFVLEIRAKGYSRDEEDDRYLSSVAYFSSPMKYYDSSIYRFYVSCSISSRNSSVFQSFGVAKCDSTGRLSERYGSGDTTIQAELGYADTRYEVYEYTSRAVSHSEWDNITSTVPYINPKSYEMMSGTEANVLYQKMLQTQFSGDATNSLFRINSAGQLWGEFPFTWEDSYASTDVQEIISRAQSLKTYKYWYGGDGRVGTQSILDSLASLYPEIYTSSYKREAALDIGKRVADCSYLVNYAYGIASPGNHGPGTSQYAGRFTRWNGTPKDGMIVWRPGHTGIFYNGKTIEMVGLKIDYREAIYQERDWQKIYYDPNRTY